MPDTPAQRFKNNLEWVALELQKHYLRLVENGCVIPEVTPEKVQNAIDLLRGPFAFPDLLIQTFIDHAYPQGFNFIFDKDLEGFLSYLPTLFPQVVTPERVNTFRYILTVKDKNGSLMIPQSEQDKIWRTFNLQVRICIKYIKEKRKGDPNYQKKINLEHEAQKWFGKPLREVN